MHISMTCREFVQLQLYAYGIDASIDNQMTRKLHAILVHFSALYYGRKPYIDTLKKYMGGIFTDCCTEILKKILRYVNEVLFEMVEHP